MAYNTVTNMAVLGGGDGCFGCLSRDRPGRSRQRIRSPNSPAWIRLRERHRRRFGRQYRVHDDRRRRQCGVLRSYHADAASPWSCRTLANSSSSAAPMSSSIRSTNCSSWPSRIRARRTGSTIYVYDTNGILQETMNGFSFSNAFNVVAMHIALNPSTRTRIRGWPIEGVNEIQGRSRT